MKKKTKKTILQWILLIAIIFAVRIWQQQGLPDGEAPVFSSRTLSGEIISSADKNPVLIHFWATWCGVCKLENDNIQDIAKDYKVLNIALSSGQSHEIAEYANEHNMRIDNIINDNNGSLSRLFKVNATPVSFIVYQNQIKFIEVGYTTTLGLRLRLWLSKWI